MHARTALEVHQRLLEGGEDAPLPALAALVVDGWLDLPVGRTLGAATLLPLLKQAATGWDEGRLWTVLKEEWERTANNARALPGGLVDHVPPLLVDGLGAAVGQPTLLDATLLMRVVDQPAVRALLQDVLGVVVADAVKRVGQPLQQNALVSGVFNRAKGLVAGSVAGGILAAVGEGLSAEAERRLTQGADDMVSMALARLVAHVCDARHVQVYAALRTRMLKAALDAPVAAWVGQVMAAHPAKAVLAVAVAARHTVLAPEFDAWLEEKLALWLPQGDVTAREFLERAGMLEPVRNTALEVARVHLDTVVRGPAFVLWLGSLFGPAQPGQAQEPAAARARKPARGGTAKTARKSKA